MPAIRIEQLSKSFRLGDRQAGMKTLRDTLGELFTKRGSRPTGDLFWALRDVNLTIEQGETVALIGQNGAGKSTLLKILSQITAPTHGKVELHGRVASLLEVGTGFHPELTGRENIFLNGAILGMTQREIIAKFDEIVAFAEVEAFIDTPVKHYSSGMYLRLAFAVAAHLEPEILLVDEVLAVGDAAFQKKCLGKMRTISGQGRTVIFVSHHLQAVSALTQRALLLKDGRCLQDGPTHEVIAAYLKQASSDGPIYQASPRDDLPTIVRAEVLTSEPGYVQAHGEALEVAFEIHTPTPIQGAALSFQVCTPLKQPVLHLLTQDSEMPLCREAGTHRLVCRIPHVHLYIGRYQLTVHFAERQGGRKFALLEDICPFEVVKLGELRDYYWQPGTCVYVEPHDWRVELI